MFDQIRKCFSLIDRRTHVEAGLLVASLFIASLFEAAVVGAIFPLVQIASAPDTLLEQPLVGRLAAEFGISDVRSILTVVAVGFLVLFILKNAFVALTVYWRCRFSLRNEAMLAIRILGIYLNSPYELHLQRNSADLINSIQSSVKQAFTYALLEGLNIASELLVVSSIVAVLVVMEPVIALSAAAAAVLAVIIVHLAMRRPFTHGGEQSLNIHRSCLQLLQQSIGGIKELKVLGREKFFIDAYGAARIAFARITIMLSVLNQMPRLLLETATVVAVVAIVLTVTAQGRSGAEVLAVLGLFGAAAFRLMPSMNRIVVSLNQMKYGAAAVEDVYRDANAPLEAAAMGGSGSAIIPFRREISLENLSFAYAGSRSHALHDIDLKIVQGESIGIVGASGAGKTTLADVMLGLLPPSSGHLRIDGADAWADIQAWRHQAGYVPQTIYLLDDTIRRNIALGLSDGEIEEDGVWRALRLAQLEEFAQQLPERLDTRVGELGVRLSGGQRQRIGVARALYRDPGLLVLDEATSALDSETEQAIGEAIERLHGLKTLIIIAHRLSTVRRCDRLLFMKSGRIAASGTFEQLLAECPDFRRTVRLASLQGGNAGEAAESASDNNSIPASSPAAVRS